MSKNKQAAIWAIVAFLTVIVGATTYAKQRPKRPIVLKTVPARKAEIIIPNQTQIATSTEVATTPITAATSTSVHVIIPIRIFKPKPKPIPPPALNYGEAVNKYANHRIQFNSICQAIPGQVAMANNITIMLDNRSDSAQKIVLAGQTYIVAAYNYILVPLNQKTLPITLHVSCNGNMNSVEITVG